ncbi:LemA family protein [Flavobacterium sp. 20NA77.7]|uniref:LemA family protein n=1 Tax=Flavobacterium nakdongensis TaxID=3073563 RepID=A0ABY9RAM8_9FLAO|nr:LemA family protein [Flavobacterium sp. 20NA77.7]WMW78288.1 LemA family protein [Flavobacterium sp. 20NA77.7]
MKKFAPVLVVVGILILGFLYFMNVKNKALLFSQVTEKEWGNVNTAYQRRLDLIDNLVNTVKGAADFEKSTLTAVVEARAKATSVTIDPKNITPAQLDQFNQAQSGITSSLSKLLVSVEAYPQLRATENFKQLQDELASTENQILTARTRFNESVLAYNGYVLAMPQNIFLGSYTEKAYFKAVAGAENAPKVKF